MLMGLRHAHMGLGYLLVLSSSVSFLLALIHAFAGNATLVRIGTLTGRRIEPGLMGVTAILGIVMWIVMGLPLTTLYLWIGVAALVLQGMIVGMGTKPALVKLAAGDDSARWRWVGAALVNAIVIYGVFGAMQAKF